MKKKIYDIVFAAQYEGLTTKEATNQLLVLFDVVGQSEQFYCELTNKTECRQTGVQCTECKKFQDTWKQ